MTDGAESQIWDDVPLVARLVERLDLLRRRAEVTATAALAALLEHPELRRRFEQTLGLSSVPDAVWDTEIHTIDEETGLTGRMDLVRRDREGRTDVIVEAKIEHTMSAGQLELYSRTQRTARIVLLLPEARREEAEGVVDGSPQQIVESWERVTDAFREPGLSPSAARDVEQFAALLNALPGPIIRPFEKGPGQQLIEQRRRDLELVVKHVTAGLQQYFHKRSTLPMRPEGDTTFVSHRSVEVQPGGTNLAVGLVSHEEGDEPLWLRYHRATEGFAAIDAVAADRFADRDTQRWGGHLWVSLTLPRGVGFAATVNSLRQQVIEIHDALVAEAAG